MALSYAQRIQKEARTNVILVMIEPSLQISRLVTPSLSWAAVSGYSNLKSTDVDLVVHGIRREVSRVFVDKMEYQRAYGKYAADATDQSFFYDSGAKKLFVHPKGGRDLDTYITTARFRTYYATHAKTFNEQYLPMIQINPEIGRIKIAVQDKLFGMGTYEGGGLVVFNSNAEWDELLETYNYVDARVTVRHGIDLGVLGTPSYDESPFSEYSKIRTATISDWKWQDANITFTLRNPSIKAKSKAHKTTLASTSDNGDNPNQAAYSNMNQQDEGRVQPHSFAGGAGTGAKPQVAWEQAYPAYCVDKGTVSKKSSILTGQKWKFNTTFTDPETELTHGNSGIDYIVTRNNASGVIQVLKAAAYSAGENGTAATMQKGYGLDLTKYSLRASFNGTKDNPSGKFTGSASGRIKRPTDLIHFYLVQMGYKTSEIDIASFTEVGVSKPDEFGNSIAGTFVVPAWVNDHLVHVDRHDTDYSQIINRILYGIRCSLQFREDGKWVLIPIDSTMADDDVSIPEAAITDFRAELILENIPSRITIKCGYNPHTSNWKLKKSDATVTIGGKSVHQNFAESCLSFDNELQVETYLRRQDGRGLGNILYNSYGTGNIDVKMTEILGLAQRILPGQRVLLNRGRAPRGPWIDKPFWALEKDADAYSGATNLHLIEAK